MEPEEVEGDAIDERRTREPSQGPARNEKGELSGAKRALLELRLARLATTRAASGDGAQGGDVVGPRPPGTAAPLSSAQERLWLLDQMDPGLTAYNAVRALRLRGPLHVDALRRALDRIVSRHEALRTRIALVDGFATTTVADGSHAGVTLTEVGVGHLPEAERVDAAMRSALMEAHRPFDLATDVLLRARLVGIGPDDHLLVLVTHHVASDEGSKGVLWTELGALYAAFSEGRADPLPPPALHYGDYAAWERGRLQSGALGEQLTWWRERLAGAPALLELPTDRPRPPVRSYAGARLSGSIDATVVRALDALARAEGTTMFMAVLAGFGAALRRWTGQDDLVVGSPISTRTRPELDHVIGLFVNTLVLRLDLSGDPTFRELVARANEAAVGAFTNQDVPFERVVEELKIERDPSRNPLFQVLFNFFDGSAGDRAVLAGLDVERVDVDPGWTKLDLALIVARKADGTLAVLWEYSTDLFDAVTVARIHDHFARLLSDAASRPDARLSGLAPLTDPEREQLRAWGDGPRRPIPDPPTVHGMVAAQARRTPDRRAIVTDSETLTYADVERRSNRLAHHLVASGVLPGALVGICMDRSAGMVDALLATLKAGAAYVPMDPSLPRARLDMMAADAGISALVTDQASAGRVDARPGMATFVLDDPAEARAVAARPAEPVTVEVAGSDLAYVIYTSGSTGKPKGVMVEHGNVANLLASMAETPGLSADDVLLAVTTLSFDIAGLELFLPLVRGATVVVASAATASDPALLADAVKSHEVTVMQATPATWGMLVDADWPGDPRLRVLCGGEALPPALADRLVERVAEVWNVYGPTETTIWSTTGRVVAGVAPGLGRPIANTRLHVVDTRLEPVPVGVAGELLIAGAGVVRGYHGRPDLTEERFVPDRWGPGRVYRTGDLVRYRTDGRLDFLGRLDHQVKIRGFRIELGEVEAALLRHPAVGAALAVVREDKPGDRRLVAYLTADGEVPAAELRDHLAGQLPAYMVPSAFVTLASFPRNPSGKVDRAALPAPGEDDVSGSGASEPPRTDTERAVADLWSDVLGVGEVGRRDDFFLLGGHSLSAIHLAARIRAQLGVSVPIRALFESSSLADLAAVIDRARPDAAGAAPPPLATRPRDPATPPPATFAQQRTWFLARLQPDSALYNVPLCLRLDGPLEVERLRTALSGLVARHETLRTTLVERAGTLFQVVADRGVLPLEHARVADAAAALDRARAEGVRPFDLRDGPLVRAALFEWGPEQRLLCLSFHHLVVDGWSLDVLLRDLATLYDGRADALPVLAVQYADYAAWQRTVLTDAVLSEDLAWWRTTLAGAPEILELPTDRPRPPVQTHRGARHSFVIDADLTRALADVASAHGATSYMLLLSAVGVLLHRYSAVDDMVVGSTVAGRPDPVLHDVVGYFANTLALRLDLSGDPTFAQLLARVKDTTVGALDHQDTPFERVVEELAPERDLSRNPLFQVLVIVQNEGTAPALLGSAGMTPVDVDRGASRFDLTVSFSRQGPAMRAAVEYATDLFDATTIERLGGHLRTLLDGLVADPERPVSKVALMAAAERHDLLGMRNDTARPFDDRSCLHHVIARQAARTPDLPAVRDPGGVLTYADLERRANQLAHHLVALGVVPGSMVGLHAERGVEMMVGLLGILKAGGAHVPLEPSYPASRLAFMVEDAQLEALLTQRALTGGPLGQVGTVVRLDDPDDQRAIAARPATDPQVAVTPDALAYVIFTSGSTGRPKGVMVEHRGVVNLMEVMAERPGLRPGEVMVGPTTPAFDLSVPDLFLPLTTGACLALAPPAIATDPRALAAYLDDVEADVMQATPATWRMLLDTGWAGRPGMRVVCGGEGYTAALASQLGQRVGEVWNFYGPTEATVWCACVRLDGHQDPLPMGRPLPNYRIYLLDSHGEPVPQGVAGEVHIAGVGLARGYLGRPDLTAEKFVADTVSGSPGGRLYRTGDLARWRTDGLLEFVGRIDHQVKVRGFRIELGEIEAVLQAHADVDEAAVVARTEGGDTQLVAYTTTRGAAPPTADDLRRHLSRELPTYMVPGAFVVMDVFPLTPNGKLDRRALPRPDLAAGRGADAYLAPRTPVEELLAAAWADVLRVERVGVHDNFFELGGHSLRVVQLISRVRDACGTELPLRTVYEGPTVAQMAETLANALVEEADLDDIEELLAEFEGDDGWTPPSPPGTNQRSG